jgi:hypothetical protein
MRGSQESSVYEDNLLGLRMLTLRFFEEGMASLSILKRDMDDFPDSEVARRRWVTAVHGFASRAQQLSERWRKVFPRLEEFGDVSIDHSLKPDDSTPRVH